MAYEKELRTRIVHKHDISDHWDLAENFVPKQGELIIYDDRTLKQNGNTLVTDQVVDTRVRYKIGDGVTTVSLLPFADKELVDAIDTLYGDDTKTLSIREIATSVLGDAEKNQNAFSKVAVANQTTVEADSTTDTLTFVAGSNVTITTDATNDTITISATDTKYEHPTSGVTAGSYRKVTVDANGHVTAGSNPTTIAGYEISDAYTKTETDNLLKDKANTSSLAAVATSGAYADLTGTPEITVTEQERTGTSQRPDTGNHTQLAFGGTLTFIDEITADEHTITSYITDYKLPEETTLSKATVQGSGNAVTDITVNGHTITLKKEATFLTEHPIITKENDTTSTASPKHGESFTAIDSVSRDSNGHVIKVNTKTITLPTETVNKNLTVGSKTYNGSTAVEITAADLGLEQAMKFIGSSSTNLTDGATTNPITINSKSVTAAAGNVVLSDGAEFVWTGSAWEKLGQDGSFSLKTHTHTIPYTPEGTVSTPTITVTPNTTTVNSITNVGTLPELTYVEDKASKITNWNAGGLTGSVSNGPNRTVTLTYTAPVLTHSEVDADSITTWNTGTLPTKSSNTTVVTGIKSASSSQPTFTGATATLTTSAANS